MKRLYTTPATWTEAMETTDMIATSNSVSAEIGSSTLKYGGVDVDGTMDPAARRFEVDIWEDEEEDW